MANLLRTLIYGGQVSLTLADTTALVQEGAHLHGLSRVSATLFGKALSAMTFMSACLKGERGEISLSLKGDGECGEIAVSGNRQLRMRGYIDNIALKAGKEDIKNATVTVIRDDGYSRPFVGACAFPDGADMDKGFEEYFRSSEQLPTRILTAVETNEGGMVEFAGVVAVQPLPFADQETLQKTENLNLKGLLDCVKEQGVFDCARAHFKEDFPVWEEREAAYKCNCSREYLTRVLVSLGEEGMRRIIQEDGAVRVHCHYCNTDYEFTDEDADKLFAKE
ncbi:MAG: Hsp33 family molecular chaperone HslO [Clostridia bacterium]|nr:Hsp33 family molecular chaperone HslO [Clostridia bacterium]